MQRHPEALVDGEFDVLVIGGGVTGACVARDAALRGLRTALVERDDFGTGASANSLKLVHGGVRHLQRLDVVQALRSARERATWMAVAPHLVNPLRILVPTFPGRFPPAPVLAAAVLAHRRMAAAFGTEERRDTATRVRLSRDECVDVVPELAGTDVNGGVLLEDALIHNAERLVLEVVLGAVAAGAVVANYVDVVDPIRRAGRLAGVRLRDRLSGSMLDVRARRIVNAAGAWAPMLDRRLTGRRREPAERHVLAFNAVMAGPAPRIAFSALAPPGYERFGRFGGRRYFVVPWRGRTLIGTGYAPFDSESAGFRPDARYRLRPEAAPIETLLDELARVVPSMFWAKDGIRRVHVGLLPASAEGGAAAVRPSRRDRILEHGADGAPELFTAVAVKLTTARSLAETVTDLVFRSLGRVPPTCRTAELPLPGATANFDEVRAAVRRAFTGPEDVAEHLARTYGARVREVVAAASALPDGWARVVAGAPVIRAELFHAVRSEMAITPEDVLEEAHRARRHRRHRRRRRTRRGGCLARIGATYPHAVHAGMPE